MLVASMLVAVAGLVPTSSASAYRGDDDFRSQGFRSFDDSGHHFGFDDSGHRGRGRHGRGQDDRHFFNRFNKSFFHNSGNGFHGAFHR